MATSQVKSFPTIHSVQSGFLNHRAKIKHLEGLLEVDPDDKYSKMQIDKLVLKRKLYLKQRGRCFFCDKTTFLHCGKSNGRKINDFATFEHVIPKKYGFKYKFDPNNFVISCYGCNNVRSDIEFWEFFILRHMFPDYKELKALISPSKYSEQDLIDKKERGRLGRLERLGY